MESAQKMNFGAEAIIKLLQIRGIGKGKVFKLANMLSFNPASDDELADVVLERVFELKIPTTTKQEVLFSFRKGEELYNKSLELGITMITFGDSRYPELLKNIANPPVMLHAKGNIEALQDMPTVAVIGTREPSAFGKSIGERIGFRLGEKKINVVSGLAIGCDTAGHVGCLMAGGITTAVLAHGLDTVYPRDNRYLLSRILESNGCAVSEYFITTKSLPNYFVERDRIQAGLSQATVVVETGIKGGTLHTVRDTLSFNRLLAILKHPLDKRNNKSEGNEMLLREEKGIPIETQEDINKLIQFVNPTKLESLPTNTSTSIEAIELPFPSYYEEESKPVEKLKKVRKKKKDEPKADSIEIIQPKLYK